MLGFLINAVIGAPFIFMESDFGAVPLLFVALLGTVQVGLAYVFFSAGIKRTPALLACLITALEPVLNPVWVALATGELPGVFAAAGGAVIVLTVVAYNISVERSARSSTRAK